MARTRFDLDLVGGGEAADEVGAGAAGLLGHGQEGRDVVAGMAIVGGQKGVVEVELADRGAVGPGGPFGVDPEFGAEAEEGGAVGAGMGQGLGAGGGDGGAVDGGDRDGGVVDEAVDEHVGDRRFDRDGVGGDGGDAPGELPVAGEPVGFGVGADFVVDHGALLSVACVPDRGPRAKRRRRGLIIVSAILISPCAASDGGVASGRAGRHDRQGVGGRLSSDLGGASREAVPARRGT